MWKLFIILLAVGVGIKGEVEDESPWVDCNDEVDGVIDNLKPEFKEKEPFRTSIPDCEICNLTGLENVARNNDTFLTKVDNCVMQTTHFIIDSAVLNCSCDLNTKSGKKTGGIHGYIEKPMFSIRVISCTEELGKLHLHEDGHIGAEKLHITCDGDDEFIKACEEEEHNYNVDNVVIAVGRSIIKVFNSREDPNRRQFDCRSFYEEFQ